MILTCTEHLSNRSGLVLELAMPVVSTVNTQII